MSLDGEAFLKKYGAQAAADAPPVARIREMGIPLACGTDGNRATSYNPGSGCTGSSPARRWAGEAAGRPQPARPHRGAAPVYDGWRLDSGEEGKKARWRPASSPTSRSSPPTTSRCRRTGSRTSSRSSPWSAGRSYTAPVPMRVSRRRFRRLRRTGCGAGIRRVLQARLQDAQNLARSFSRPQLIADGVGKACGCGRFERLGAPRFPRGRYIEMSCCFSSSSSGNMRGSAERTGRACTATAGRTSISRVAVVPQPIAWPISCATTLRATFGNENGGCAMP